jgi:hypothetical protein
VKGKSKGNSRSFDSLRSLRMTAFWGGLAFEAWGADPIAQTHNPVAQILNPIAQIQLR